MIPGAVTGPEGVGFLSADRPGYDRRIVWRGRESNREIAASELMSGIRHSRHYLSGMLKKNWGRILFISSESAMQIPAEMFTMA